MRLTKSALSTVLAAALAVTALTAAAPVSSSYSPEDAEVAAALEERFATFGVPEAQWPSLVETILDGGELLSSSDEPPVSVEPYIRDDMSGTISRWSDGSFETSLAEIPEFSDPRIVGTQAISGCSVYSSAGAINHTNCLVEVANAVATMSFAASWWQTSNLSSISAWDNYNAFVPFASWTKEYFGRKQTNGYSNSSPSYVQFTIMANYPWANSRLTLELRVSPSSYWTVDNF